MHQTKSSAGAGAKHRRAPPPDPTIIRTVSEHNKSLSATHLLHPPSTVIHSVALGKSKSQRKATQQKSSDESKKKEKCEIELMTHLFSHHNPNPNNNAKVVSVDMPPFMQIHALNFATKAYHTLQNITPKALALTLKKEFDGVYGAAWHCIVGSSFGSFVTHSVGGFIYFSMDHKLYVLLFKTSIKRPT
ncbi:dynein light chain 4, axonemal-like [Ipomoea triloba]|uniref:dynein light chain 4, axonemal-like n=1 Tax=Ipomoea triloba TaxID=35885 RepID=UPI00125E2CD1|nr:dynein light chain 4, axonemal-like [Ipomoea triloba]